MELPYSFLLVALISTLATSWEVSWNEYKGEFHKLYSTRDDDIKRLKAFNESVAYVEKHHELYEEGKVLFDVKITNLADALPSEYGGFNPEGRKPAPHKFNWSYVDQERFLDDLPLYVNWAEKGLIGRVYDQEKCGCCYAFAATQAIESQWKLLHNVKIELSNKMLLDCTWDYGNSGCKGGLMSSCYKFIRDNGIALEQDYPFKAKEETCQSRVRRYNASLYTYVDIDSDEDLIKVAVAKGGPVAVGIFSKCKPFQLYSKGIFDCTNCQSRGLDHALVIYGYGTTKSGVDYWLAKNAWGEEWGEKGHCKIIRGKNCLNLRMLPSIPFISEASFKKFMGDYNAYARN